MSLSFLLLAVKGHLGFYICMKDEQNFVVRACFCFSVLLLYMWHCSKLTRTCGFDKQLPCVSFSIDFYYIFFSNEAIIHMDSVCLW